MSENSQCWIIVCYSTTMGIRYGHMACCTTKYLFPQESFLPRWPWLFFSGAVVKTCQPHAFIGKKNLPMPKKRGEHIDHSGKSNFCSWNFTRNQKFVWCKSSQLSWNSAAFVIYKSRQTRQEINKLLPLGARWIPATSNQWMIFSQKYVFWTIPMINPS